MHQKTIGIIPARYGSTRFVGKPLAMIFGKTMVQRVYEQAGKAKRLDKIIVATDDARIFDAVQSFGGEAIMTAETCLNGTERCAEVLSKLPENYHFAVNIQGDEPFIAPEQIDALVEILTQQPTTMVATLVRKINHTDDLFNPNIVKAVVSTQAKALYFSRQALPFVRGTPEKEWLQHHTFYQHIGLYAYKADCVAQLAAYAPTLLEGAESLEQLRWLENGINIGVAVTELATIGIDTPEDLQKILQNHIF